MERIILSNCTGRSHIIMHSAVDEDVIAIVAMSLRVVSFPVCAGLFW